MATPSNNPSDPRPTWRLVSRITGLVPQWLLRFIANTLIRIILYWGGGSQPVYRGLQLWVEGANADLYLVRLKTALDLLDAYAPVYLRWLGSSFRLLQVNQLFMIMRKATDSDYGTRILTIHPYTAWNASGEQLALYLVASATLGRLGRRSRRFRAATRAKRRALTEMIGCAHKLPGAQDLASKWEEHLKTFDDRFPEAAA